MDKHLLQILACPKCKGNLELSSNNDALICMECSTVYPVIDEIPVLLTEKGVSLEEWKKGIPEQWKENKTNS